jgi:FixJ family two-component response regulator
MSVRAMTRGVIEFLTKPVHDQNCWTRSSLPSRRTAPAETPNKHVSGLPAYFRTLTPREPGASR